jgi:solute carrier family 30 (zinc transporter), member 2
MSAQVDLAF